MIFGAWIAYSQSEYYGTLIATPAALLVLLSGAGYPGVLMIRDVSLYGHKPRRFSLLQLLGALTGASIGWGMLMYLLRKLL